MSDAPKSPVFTREATGLTRALSAKDVLMFNLINMGFPFILTLTYFAASLYQGIDFSLSTIIALPAVLSIALLYYMLAKTFPRAGGDYVWVSRLIHPAIGFMVSFAIFVFMLAFVGAAGASVMLFGLSTIFLNLSYVSANAMYLNLASQVTTSSAVFLNNIIILAIILLAASFQLKRTFRFMWILLGVEALGVLTFIIAMLGAGPIGFQAAFNTHSGASWQAIIDAANKSGFTTTFTGSGTLLGIAYVFLAYSGFWFSSYLGGEVKRAGESQFFGIVGSVIVFAIVAFALSNIIYYVFGAQFFNAASLLAGFGSPHYTLPSPPVASFLVIFASPNPLVAILVPLAVIVAIVGSLQSLFVATVRMVFAWSFDRVLPEKFSQLGRSGAPIYALALVGLVALVHVVSYTFAPSILTFYSYGTSGMFLAISFIGIAATIFPYRRDDLFAQATPPANKRIVGIPVISILGLIVALVGVLIAYSAAAPAFTGTAVNAQYLVFLALVFLAGLVVYGVSYYIRKRQGIDLSMILKTIPPE